MNLQGLKKEDVEKYRIKYGSNKLTQLEPDSLWQKILEGFKDPMIMILLVALVVQLVLFAMGQAEWFEPVGIFVAIIIANGVAAFSENSQENKASALKAEEEAKEIAKVIRDGYLQEIHVDDVVVGDIVYLQAGDKIPADKKPGIEQALQQLKDAHKAGDVAAIDTAINNLNTVMQAASQQMYQGGQQAGPQGAQGGQQSQGANDGAQDVQDADFEEVK